MPRGALRQVCLKPAGHRLELGQKTQNAPRGIKTVCLLPETSGTGQYSQKTQNAPRGIKTHLEVPHLRYADFLVRKHKMPRGALRRTTLH